MTCTVVRPTADHSSQSITSSADVRMSNWTAAEIQEMLASPRSLQLSSLSACCCCLNSSGVKCKALILKTNSTCFLLTNGGGEALCRTLPLIAGA